MRVGSLDYTKLWPAFSGRYYLDKGKVVDMKVKGIKRAEETPTKTYVIKLIADSKDYMKSLRAHFKKPRPAPAT
jgi:hypothetical protein